MTPALITITEKSNGHIIYFTRDLGGISNCVSTDPIETARKVASLLTGIPMESIAITFEGEEATEEGS